MSHKKDEWVRSFECGHLDKDLFSVECLMYPTGFPEASKRISVTKRFTDFQKLYSNLSQTHRNLYLKGTFPVFVKTKIRKKVDPVEACAKIKDMFQFSALHPQLYSSQAYIDFFPADIATRDEAKQKLLELRKSGNLMDATALSSKIISDTTPTLSPSPTPSNSALTPPMKGSTPTTPEEGMQNLPDYLSEAAIAVSEALQRESEERFDESIECYRNAISTLLTSVQTDRCLKRQASVKRRIAQYITKAESLVAEREAREEPAGSDPPDSLHPVPDSPGVELFGDMEDLKKYRVSSVLAKTVMLATNLQTGTLVVIKPLLKATTSGKDSRRRSVLPIGVPNMAQLLCYFETNESIFLILEYFQVGHLYEQIKYIFYNSEKLGEIQARKADTDTVPLPSTKTMDSITKGATVERDIDGETNEDDDDDKNDLDIIHTTTDPEGKIKSLICVNGVALENIDLTSDTDDENSVDFCEEFDLEEGEEAEEDHDEKDEKILSKSSDLLARINSKLTSDDGSKAERILDELQKIEHSIEVLKISGKSSAPVLRPFGNAKINPDMLVPIFAHHGVTNDSCRIPLTLLKTWSSQLLRSLFALHERGIIIKDLNPQNVLMDEVGNLRLTYQFDWVSVNRSLDPMALQCYYASPEVRGIEEASPASDFWSLGVILYELATGRLLVDIFPSGIRVHTPIELAGFDLDSDLTDFITSLVQPVPETRLGYGPGGVRAIKGHPFLRSISWASQAKQT